MNARWELAAALAAAGLMVALAVLTARDEAAPDSVEDTRRTSSMAVGRENGRAIAGFDPQRRPALPASSALDVRAVLDDANAAAGAEVEGDGPARALETLAIASPERIARPDAIAELASRLGFQPRSRDSDDLARWLEESARADREALADAASLNDSNQARVAAFNAGADDRRRALIERFGLLAAEEIARRFPVHRLDPQSGALVRVDPHGRPLSLTGQD